MAQPPTIDISALVPSSRDFLQAVRTGRKGLSLVPCLAAEESARESVRMGEAGVTALALREPSPAMRSAAQAARLPVLSLSPIRSREEALAARAAEADAVLIDPTLDAAARDAVSSHARSTRMVAIPLARTKADVEEAVTRGAKAVAIQAAGAKSLADLASAAGRLVTIALPQSPIGEELGLLRGAFDAVVVDVDVYGATGFERLVSELNP